MVVELQVQKVEPKKVPDFSSSSWKAAPDNPASGEVEKELEKARKAPPGEERDDWYFSAMVHALWRDDLPRAQVAAKGISDPSRARQARSFIKLAQIRESVMVGDVASAIRLVEAIETPLHRVQGPVWLADQHQTKGDSPGAVALLLSAASTATKVEDSLPRAQAFLAISKSASGIDFTLSFEAMQSAIKSLSSVRAPSIKDVRSKGGAFGFPQATRFGPFGMIKGAEIGGMAFNLFETLSKLAVKDFYGSLLLVDGIEPLELKLLGQLALARSQTNETSEPGKRG